MPDPITSPQNPRVKAIVALRERKERQRSGLMVVEGHDELGVALDSGARPHELYICPPLFRGGQSALLERVADLPQIEVGERAFEKMAYRENPDGWLATFPLVGLMLAELPLSATPLLVVCETVEKPGNLGAILRTADAAGVDALIATDPLSDWGNPNVVRASKGALFTVPVSSANNRATLDYLRQHGIAVVVATPDAPTRYTDADLRQPCALLVGAEHAGVSRFWLDAADLTVSIPMFGKVNSLNVSAATALLLYEAVRQRQ